MTKVLIEVNLILGYVMKTDNRLCFLQKSANYLLYWWQKLDEYNLVSFACLHLPCYLTADTNSAAEVSSISNKILCRLPTNKSNKNTSRKYKLVRNSMSDLVDCQTQEQIEKLEDTKLGLELKLEDLDYSCDAGKITKIQKRIEKLDNKIKILESNIIKKWRTDKARNSDSHSSTAASGFWVPLKISSCIIF